MHANESSVLFKTLQIMSTDCRLSPKLEKIVQFEISSCNNLKASGTKLECQAPIKHII